MSYGVSRDVVARIAGQRCATCNHVTVDAWICGACAHDFAVVRADERFTTPTAVGRGLQRRVDNAAAYEQLLQMQSIMDSGVSPVELRSSTRHKERRSTGEPPPVLSEHRRSMKIRKMMHAANNVGWFAELRAVKLPEDEQAWWFK